MKKCIHEQNREDLIKLAHEMKVFDENEIIGAFLKTRGNIAVDSHQTIHDYLFELVEIKKLKHGNGLFWIPSHPGPK